MSNSSPLMTLGLIGAGAYIAGSYFGLWSAPSWLSGIPGAAPATPAAGGGTAAGTAAPSVYIPTPASSPMALALQAADSGNQLETVSGWNWILQHLNSSYDIITVDTQYGQNKISAEDYVSLRRLLGLSVTAPSVSATITFNPVGRITTPGGPAVGSPGGVVSAGRLTVGSPTAIGPGGRPRGLGCGCDCGGKCGGDKGHGPAPGFGPGGYVQKRSIIQRATGIPGGAGYVPKRRSMIGINTANYRPAGVE